MHNPCFSSGPCSKRPGWGIEVLKDALIGRSHRSAAGKERLFRAIEETKRILEVPDGFLVGIMPGSDTGAFEAAMWNLLGPKKVTVLVWESFSEGWATDVEKQLKLSPKIMRAPYGELPDLKKIDWDTDVVFVANGTTSGVMVPGWDWIPSDRGGLSLCDATSAVFAMEIDWSKIDCLTFSWQKCLGGEAAHGMLILGPRAIERLESYEPPWPLPKIFRIKKGGKVNREIFEGDTINTPSLLCVEDYLDALRWASELGLSGLIAKSKANFRIVEKWVDKNKDWIQFLASDPATRSHTSVCLKVVDPRVVSLSKGEQEKFLKGISSELAVRGVAYDINPYREAPPGFRFWCGPTVEGKDLEKALEALADLFKERVQLL
ncbi:MAG: phosphoserine transaminase [Syntrophales bacterium]|nr:phosphoserine transaminase [Syntrophales bacterium]